MTTKPLDRLMFAQGGLCFFCREPLPRAEASLEHLFASANGGGNTIDNCVACCKSVNSLFGSMSLKDKFQVVLNQNGSFKCPRSSSAEKLVPLPNSSSVTAPTGSKVDTFSMVVANLTQRGNSRPRTLKTLTSTVASLLPKRPEAEVTAVIQRLQSTGKILVVENKVTYDL